jgi:hypothetical protein
MEVVCWGTVGAASHDSHLAPVVPRLLDWGWKEWDVRDSCSKHGNVNREGEN